MKNILLLITSIVSLFALILLFVSYIERPSTKLDNYDELIASGLIEKGWAPKFIPKSATEIYEQHNLDTNMMIINFRYVPSEKEMSVENCTLLVENDRGKKYICPPLEGQTSILTLREDGVGYYRSDSDGLY